ncbi:MAG: hypothetical protein V4619_16555 [Bacteroidota bacterium]
MKSQRKIAIVAKHIQTGDEDAADVAFWLSRSPAERLEEVVRLRRNYFTWLNGEFPSKIEKVINKKRLK